MRLLFAAPLLACACGSVSSPSGDPDAGPDGPPDDGPKMVTFTTQLNNGTPSNIELAAYKDGDSAWQAITGTAGVYTFMVTSKRYAIATACERTTGLIGSTDVQVRYLAVSDGLTRFGIDSCTAVDSTLVTINGNVVAAPAGQAVRVSSGNSLVTAANNAWSLSVLPGAGTLVGLSISAALPPRPTSVLLRKGTFAEGSAFSLDFANGFFPAESALTVDPTATEPVVSTAYLDEDGGNHAIETTSGAATYRVVPADRIGNGISTLTLSQSDTGAFRSITRAFKNPVAQTLTLPAAFVPTSAPVAVGTAPYPIYETVLARRSDAAFYQVRYVSRPSRVVLHSWELTATAAWLEGQPGDSITVRLPDLSGLTGWKPAYALTNAATWNASVTNAPKSLIPGATGNGVTGGSVGKLAVGEQSTLSSSSGSVSAQ